MFKQESQPNQFIERLISHERLLEIADRNNLFYSDPRSIEFLLFQYENFKAVFTFKDYVEAVGGMVFPFYYLDHGGLPEEFSRFNSEVVSSIKLDEKLNINGWVCAKCQGDNQLQDLKTFCMECDTSKLKPRDIFKLVPDLDILLVVDNFNLLTAKDISDTCRVANFMPSDPDIEETINRLEDTFDSFEQGKQKQKPFPIDVHVVGVETLIDSLKDIQNGNLKTVLSTRALYTDWQISDLPLLFDFVFSLSFSKLNNNDLQLEINKTEKFVKENFSFDQLVEVLSSTNPRAERLLKEDSIKLNLKSRYDKW